MKTIEEFKGQHRFLSNFWYSDIKLDGVIYPTVEHAFQAAKTNVTSQREEIRKADTPGTAKALGRSVSLRAGWEDTKIGVMVELLAQKFKSGELRKMLLETGNSELIEGNTWNDKFWGVCQGEGENWLGQCLMHIRNSHQLHEEKLKEEE